MYSLLSILVLASIVTSSWSDVITPEPVTVAPAEVHPDKPMPGIANLLETLGISDASGKIRKFLKFFTDPNMRNESANAYNGFRQGFIDASSCFRQKLKSELKDQKDLVTKFVEAMHQVQIPAESQNTTDDEVLTILSPELNVLNQLWTNPQFQDAFGQLQLKVIASGQEGLRCLRQRFKTIRPDVEWILGHALHTFRTSTPAPNLDSNLSTSSPTK